VECPSVIVTHLILPSQYNNLGKEVHSVQA
jgi:hypothetical protein